MPIRISYCFLIRLWGTYGTLKRNCQLQLDVERSQIQGYPSNLGTEQALRISRQKLKFRLKRILGLRRQIRQWKIRSGTTHATSSENRPEISNLDHQNFERRRFQRGEPGDLQPRSNNVRTCFVNCRIFPSRKRRGPSSLLDSAWFKSIKSI